MPALKCERPLCWRRRPCPVHGGGIRHSERRKSSNERGYTWRWRQFAKRYLELNPLCVHCLDAGRTEPATEVDHIVPHRGDMEAFWRAVPNGVQALCHDCHEAKTAKGL